MSHSSAPQVTVLISGTGSNLRALLEHQEGYKISAVVSNRAEAGGLDHARAFDVPSYVVLREQFDSLSRFKQAVLDQVVATKPDLVALAGFMMVLQPEFIGTFEDRLLNIHPSLLPKFPGLHTHQRALEAGETEHGCSVHFVDAGVDTGPLIAQASVQIQPSDTAETLAARVLSKEHVLYPWCLSAVARGDISVSGRGVSYSPALRANAQLRDFNIFHQEALQ